MCLTGLAQGVLKSILKGIEMEEVADGSLLRRQSTRSTVSQGDIFDREDFNSVDFINKLFPTGKFCDFMIKGRGFIVMWGFCLLVNLLRW